RGQRRQQAVAEEVEDELLVSAVDDVALVQPPALLGAHVVLERRDREAEPAVGGAAGGSVAPGQVVVHGHDVHTPAAAAAEGVQGSGEDGGDGLALAGGHLGKAPARHDQRAGDLLDVQGEADLASDNLAHDGKGAVDGGGVVAQTDGGG